MFADILNDLNELLDEATINHGTSKGVFWLSALRVGESANEGNFTFIGTWEIKGTPVEFRIIASSAESAQQIEQFRRHCKIAGALLLRYPPNLLGFPVGNDPLSFPIGRPCNAETYWIAALFSLFLSSDNELESCGKHQCLQYPWLQSMKALQSWSANLICSQLQATPTPCPPGPAPETGGAGSAADDSVPWPECMTSNDLADRLKLPREATRKKLARLAKKCDCSIPNESPRKGESHTLYHVKTVLPELRK
jgi:hypothetical protein